MIVQTEIQNNNTLMKNSSDSNSTNFKDSECITEIEEELLRKLLNNID